MGMAGLWEVRLLWGVLHRNCISRSTPHTEHSKMLPLSCQRTVLPRCKESFPELKGHSPLIHKLKGLILAWALLSPSLYCFILSPVDIQFSSLSVVRKKICLNLLKLCETKICSQTSTTPVQASRIPGDRWWLHTWIEPGQSFLLSAHLDFTAVFSGILFPQLPFFSFFFHFLWLGCLKYGFIVI